jgi:4-amino-4-deoxy-L-arabinose transferase-like glycosyltransferase
VGGGGPDRPAHAADHGGFLSADERAYTKLAAAIVHGRYSAPGMEDPLHWPPGTPMLFAAGRALGGSEGQYWAQFAIGLALVGAVFALAAIVAGAWAGVIAAAAIALYPPLAIITGDLVSEPLGALATVVVVVALAWAWRGPPSWRRFALAGAATGAAILVRADLLVLPIVLAALVAATTRSWRATGAFLAAAVLALAPWSVYASVRRGSLVPVTSSSWSSLYVGTYLPGDGRMYGVREALGDEARARNPSIRHIPNQNLRAEWILDTVAARHPKLGRSAALEAETKRNLRRYALGRPLAFAAMQARKVERMWIGYDRGTHHRERAWILAVHLALAAVGLAGLLWGLVRTRHPALWAILLTVLTVTAVNSFFVSEARHNVRVMPLLVAGGVAGIVLTRRARAGRSGPPRTAPGAGPPVSAASPRAAAAAR